MKKNLWDTKKIDQENFKKHGINNTIRSVVIHLIPKSVSLKLLSFIGGHPLVPKAPLLFKMINHTWSSPLIFAYFCCTPGQSTPHHFKHIY